MKIHTSMLAVTLMCLSPLALANHDPDAAQMGHSRIDANGDGWIDTIEWNKAGKADADFKAKDKDANGQLDNGEYGCQDSAPGGVAPDGKG